MGDSFALWYRRHSAAARSIPGVWTAATLSRQSFWVEFLRDRGSGLRGGLLRDILCAPTSAAFGRSASGWPESARVRVARSKRKVTGTGRSAFAQWRGPAL